MPQAPQQLDKTPLLAENSGISLFIKLISLTFLFFVAKQLTSFPSFKMELAVALVLYAIALSIWPKTWMLILPTLLPVLDLTPWSGRILITEFDLFVLSSISISLLFNRLDFSFLKTTGPIKWIILLLTLSYSLSTIIGFLHLKQLHTTSFYLYLTEYNSLRVAKGFFSALLFLPILAYEKNQGTPIAKIFSTGIVSGLVLAIISIIWERTIFPGFFDFSNTYRISGLFSGMLLGGAMVDGYLLLAFPFFFILFYSFNKPWLHILGILIFTWGLYSILVTFTRTNYLAVSASIFILFWGNRYIRHKVTRHTIFSYFVFTAIALLVVVSIFKGGYISQRFSTTFTNFDQRLEHWSNAIQLKNNGITPLLLGDGKGSYPNTYINNDSTGLTMGRFWLEKENTQNNQTSYIRFSPSDNQGTLKVIQRFPVNQIGTYKVKITLRNHTEQPQKLLVEFCKKNILQFMSECTWLGFTTQKDKINEWHTITENLSSDSLSNGLLSAVTPVDIDLLNRGLNEKLDIGQVEIVAPNGEQVLKNTQFKDGFDHWFFSSGNHLAWHIKNIWISAFFEGGLIELSLITILLIWLTIRLFKLTREGNHYALVMLAAIIGIMIVGLFDSIFDEPRISWFFFLITWLAVLKPEKEKQLDREKNAWLFSLIGLTIFSSVALGAALHIIEKLDYSVEDVASIFIETTMKKLNIEADQSYLAILDFPAIEQWRGQGANTLYNKITTKYDLLEKPLAISENAQGTTFSRLVKVSDNKQLMQAIQQAEPGDRIELQAGIYSINEHIYISKDATTHNPIVIYAKQLGDVLIEFDTVEGFKVDAANWTFQNLMIKGDCQSHDKCEHAFHIIGRADGTILRNNIIYDFNSAIKANGTLFTDGTLIYPDNVLIEKNSFTNTSPRNTESPVTTIDVVGGDNFRIKANLISDFIKLQSDKTSYAAFLKGYGKKGLIEENLVICNMKLYQPGHTQVGLSLGGGGTGTEFCFDKKCEYEHDQGTLQNNIIMNCNDVGIYINKGKDTNIINNTLYNTAGIDIRFPQSNALVTNNLLNGKIRLRNKASVIDKNNLETDSQDEFRTWFINPDLANFSLPTSSTTPLPLFKSLNTRDYCASIAKNKDRFVGATMKNSDSECLNILSNNLPVLITLFDEKAHQTIKQQEKLQRFYENEKNLKNEITLCNRGCEYTDLDEALKAIKSNGTIYIEQGEYETCGYIKRPAHIIGKSFQDQKAHLIRKACDNKAAIVINAPNVTIENIEISEIHVDDNNGACLRIEDEASDLLINKVYCHDNQAGIIGNIQTGKLSLENSIFERNGFNNGEVNNVSINSKGTIEILNSKILATREKGHSIQINAPKILIDNSIIAVLNGQNSRAIDNTIGGELTIKNSIIQQGSNSDNNEMIGFALGDEKSLLAKQSVLLENNWLIFDKKKTMLPFFSINKSKIFRTQHKAVLTLKNNTIIGMGSLGADDVIMEENITYKTREEAELYDHNGILLSVPIKED